MFHKVSEENNLFQSTWPEAQDWCNFVLLKPESLPENVLELSNQMRSESPSVRASHKAEFGNKKRRFSLKQFLYDWAPPAYDHPSLWRNSRISKPEDTPIPKPHLIGNNYMWIGLDHRRKPAASMNIMRTQVEFTVIDGAFTDEEIIQIFSSLKPVDKEATEKNLSCSYAELSHQYRNKSPTISVPVSYFKHSRSVEEQGYCYIVSEFTRKFPNTYLQNIDIDGYRCNSVFAFGWDNDKHLETEYLFESKVEPGIYIRILVTSNAASNKIPFPASLSDQECNYIEAKLHDGTSLYHAWSKYNDNGSHSLIFKKSNSIINLIIKPAPWTGIEWARSLCEKIYKFKDVTNRA